MANRKQSWVAWAPHTNRAFRADTEVSAKRAAREWSSGYGYMPSWRAMAKEDWRVTRVDEGASDE